MAGSLVHLDTDAPVKTLCVMDSVSRANGGIFEAERRLQQTLHARTGIDVRIVGLKDSYTELDHEIWAPLVPVTYAVEGPRSFGYAPGLVDALVKAEGDLAGFVGLWKFPSVAALQWAQRTKKPFLVTPHGMLDAWALRNSRTKKRIAGWLFQNEQLKKASCLRALCLAEAQSIRAYGLQNPICIVPNGIDIPPASVEGCPNSSSSLFPVGCKVLLYLGRLHPKKGLSHLLTAWSRVSKGRSSDWLLAIAGWDQGGHEAELKQQAEELGISWKEGGSQNLQEASVFFLGPKFGESKAEIFSNCDAFVLPSLSEGQPMVILEAWAYGKPVLMTPECNLPEGFSAGAALRVESTAESIVEGLNQLFELTPAQREEMGKSGLALVRDRFAWPEIAIEIKSVYDWMLGGGPKPGCISDT